MLTRALISFSLILLSACEAHKNKVDDKSANEVQYELNDSTKLSHVAKQFYKNSNGHLFELTWADKEGPDNKLTSRKYFNGVIPQELDPYTFSQLDGWYAKDKSSVYFYRPTSGGMTYNKIEAADLKTFNLLDGHYNFAVDKNQIYHEAEILKGINPKSYKLQLDSNGFVVGISSGSKTFHF